MKKNLLSVLILALLIMNTVLNTVMMVSVISTNSKTGKLVTSIATVMNLEFTEPGGETAETEVPLSQTDTYNMEELTILLKPDENGEQAYIVFDMTLAMDTKNKDYKKLGSGETLAEYEMMIRSTVENVVAAHTKAECSSNFEGIREEILEAVQNLFQSDFIYRIAISNVKYGSAM